MPLITLIGPWCVEALVLGWGIGGMLQQLIQVMRRLCQAIQHGTGAVLRIQLGLGALFQLSTTLTQGCVAKGAG